MTKPREKTREGSTAEIEDGAAGWPSGAGKKGKFSLEETERFSFPRLGGRGLGSGLANGAKAAILE